jgi:uncharacterized protein YecT (DUF1311 family)
MRIVRWLLLACVAFAAPAAAEEPRTAAGCSALASAAQSGCLEKLVKAADAKLNEVYQRAIAVIEKSDSADVPAWKAAFKKAEQAWIAFRHIDCGALVGYEWGHGTGMSAATPARKDRAANSRADRALHRAALSAISERAPAADRFEAGRGGGEPHRVSRKEIFTRNKVVLYTFFRADSPRIGRRTKVVEMKQNETSQQKKIRDAAQPSDVTEQSYPAALN